MKNITRQITPLTNNDFFVVLYHPNACFDYPTHHHPEYELNYVENATGKRIVGDSMLKYENIDLVLVGPDLYHSWKSDTERADLVVTIQFHNNLFPANFQNKKMFSTINDMLKKSERGIEFSKETIHLIAPRLKTLIHEKGFYSFIEFLTILYELSISAEQKVLCSQTFSPELDMFKSRRIKLACDYINKNYQNKITLHEIAQLTNMTETSFCHFFKKRTYKSFVDYINDVRIGHASVQLIESTKSISEVCYDCGFNNISNFNRIFKSKKGVTPTDFRKYNLQQIQKY
jgi:AraC-like DNA-binding protein